MTIHMYVPDILSKKKDDGQGNRATNRELTVKFESTPADSMRDADGRKAPDFELSNQSPVVGRGPIVVEFREGNYNQG